MPTWNLTACRCPLGDGTRGDPGRHGLRAPKTLRVPGAVTCTQGLSATILGPEHARTGLEWETMCPGLLRAGEIVALASGLFMVFAMTLVAVTPRSRRPPSGRSPRCAFSSTVSRMSSRPSKSVNRGLPVALVSGARGSCGPDHVGGWLSSFHWTISGPLSVPATLTDSVGLSIVRSSRAVNACVRGLREDLERSAAGAQAASICAHRSRGEGAIGVAEHHVAHALRVLDRAWVIASTWAATTCAVLHGGAPCRSWPRSGPFGRPPLRPFSRTVLLAQSGPSVSAG